MQAQAADDVQFNTDILDLKDRTRIDLSQFSRAGYVMPGEYIMTLQINQQRLPEQKVTFFPPDTDPKGSDACITPAMVTQLGLKDKMLPHLTWWHQGQCLNIHSLNGMEARGDIATQSLYLSIPQAYQEYSGADWDPPSRWDNGIPGVLFDYNVNTQLMHSQKTGGQDLDLSANGSTGGNLGAWRLRADWQVQHVGQQTGKPDTYRWDWSRYYAYRAIGGLKAKLMVGGSDLRSDLFSNFHYTGVSLSSDESMLPPSLRGYAPEVTGIARTNAKVTISQQGRVIYETQVAAGPFRLQELNEAVSGKLDVKVQEQDGTVQTFQVSTASVPYLTRPGAVRYKLAAGKPSNMKYQLDGPTFATGEASWGVSNGWSLFGGSIVGKGYDSANMGIGRDLLALGAISFDATEARAQLPQGIRQGASYRLNYSKRFDQYDSEVSFAGYRFSEKQFMSMGDYVTALQTRRVIHSSKEMYSVYLNKQFRDAGLSTYLTYDHQTYWDTSDSDRYSLSLTKTLSLGPIKDLNLTTLLSRTKNDGVNDDAVFVSVSLPWGHDSVSFDASQGRYDSSQNVSYNHQISDRDNYQLRTGLSQGNGSGSAFINHQGDAAQVTANVNYQPGQYTSAGMSLTGGVTATAQGVALHRTGLAGGTRLMLDTDGVADVPIHGYGVASRTNRFGKAVITEVNSYTRNDLSIDLNALGDNVEATQSVTEATLTEGAIGYRHLDVIAGQKAMASIHLADGTAPPFGATVTDDRHHETGIVNDAGSTYLSGIRPDGSMQVHWDGRPQCVITMPHVLPTTGIMSLLLPCREIVPLGVKATNTKRP